jgi:hypothetical protein
MEVRFPFLLGLKEFFSHSDNNEPINRREDVKWKTKRQAESDKAEQRPEKDLPSVETGGGFEKV